MLFPVVLSLAGLTALGQPPPPLPPSYQPTADEIAAVRTKLAALEAKRKALSRTADAGLLAEVEVYHKAGDFILRHPEEFLTKAYLENTLKVLDAGMARAAELESGRPSWPSRKGRVARAYRSRVDGSVQPYMVIVPETYDGRSPMRLDLVLHGRNARLNEVSFLADAEWGKPVTPLGDRIELHVYGRTNNAYRWSGETDVFEALAAAEARYKVDPNRIVLRGFSMGGAGTWHIGLHHPDRWAAIEAGAGFTDTRGHAKISDAPEHETLAWTIYDAYLYARNTVMVPSVGYGSIDDPQLRAARLVQEQLARETLVPTDLRTLFLVGPPVGHKFAPESKKESEAFLAQALAAGRRVPDRVRFVTYTTRYNRCFWIRVEGLDQHYRRAEIDAQRKGNQVEVEAKGVSRLSFETNADVRIDGQSLRNVREIEKRDGKWAAASKNGGLRKRHGLQGPIDDAFMDSFLCVRPSGTPRDTASHRMAIDRLETFRREYDKYLRADIPIKSDNEITDADIRNNHLVLFGDPGSNKLIARVLAKSPLRWDAKSVRIGARTFEGDNQLLIAIYPNPLNPEKYVVINSGHTFGEKDFKGTNALLYPRLGDWAVLDGQGKLRDAGFFNERWE
jgi:dienelactone hydrolase